MNQNDKKILETIAHLNNAINNCNNKEEFTKLRKSVGDLSRQVEKISDSLTSYQKQRLSDELDTLTKLVNTKDGSLNGQRFEFRGQPIAPPSEPIKRAERKATSTRLEVGVADIHSTRKIINSVDSHLLLEKFSSSIITSDKMFPSIHVQDGRDSIIYLESDGPIFMHTLKNVTLFLKCHQLRLHNITNCTLLVNVSNNRVIIEDCTELTIGNFSRDCEDKIYVDDFDRPNLAENEVNYREIIDYGIYDAFPWINKIGEGVLSDEVKGKMICYVKE